MNLLVAVRQGVGTVIIIYQDQTELLNHRNGWVVCHISELKMKFIFFTGPTRIEPPKLRMMTMEEIESDHDTNDENGDYENN